MLYKSAHLLLSFNITVLLTFFFFFFFNDTATTEIYTLSLHDALPISPYFVEGSEPESMHQAMAATMEHCISEIRKIQQTARKKDRKSTRLNSSHANISYAVFCLKKKKHSKQVTTRTTNRNASNRTWES